MDDIQFDLFGNATPVARVANPKIKESTKERFRKMYGYDESHQCGECLYCFKKTADGNIYHKCQLIGVSDTTETDIEPSDVSCKRWEQKG